MSFFHRCEDVSKTFVEKHKKAIEIGAVTASMLAGVGLIVEATGAITPLAAGMNVVVSNAETLAAEIAPDLP